MSKSVSRKNLIELSRKQELSDQEMKQLSRQDAELLDLMRQFRVDGRQSLLDAPPIFVQRAKNIIRTKDEKSLASRIKSLLVFDSWYAPGYVGVRGPGTYAERRIRFEVGSYEVDIRGESEAGVWNFVAEITGENREGLRLKSGPDTIASIDNNWFEWSSKKPPRELVLITAENKELKLPKISWKQPSTK